MLSLRTPRTHGRYTPLKQIIHEMTEKIKVETFLKSGKFGELEEIRFGILRADLFEILGETEWIHYSSKKSKHPAIYRYGLVEFYFEEGEDGRLNGIQICPIYQEADLNKLNIDYGIYKSEIGYENCLKHLKNLSIGYDKVVSKYDTKDVRRIKTEGNVNLIFSENENEIVLYKISKFVDLGYHKPEMKQISFSVSAQNYELIRNMAKMKKISISNICKQIIEENINKNNGV